MAQGPRGTGRTSAPPVIAARSGCPHARSAAGIRGPEAGSAWRAGALRHAWRVRHPRCGTVHRQGVRGIIGRAARDRQNGGVPAAMTAGSPLRARARRKGPRDEEATVGGHPGVQHGRGPYRRLHHPPLGERHGRGASGGRGARRKLREAQLSPPERVSVAAACEAASVCPAPEQPHSGEAGAPDGHAWPWHHGSGSSSPAGPMPITGSGAPTPS